MQKHITILATCAALLAGTALNAQSLALPKTDAPNFTVSVGPTYMKAKLKIEGISAKTDLYGTTAAFAWRIDAQNSISADIGFLFGSDKESDMFGSYKDEYTLVPVMFSYNFSIPFGDNSQFEARIAPAIGFTYFKDEYTETYYGYGSDTYSVNDTALSYGIGLGFAWHINTKLFLDFSYRYTHTKFKFNEFGYSFDAKANAHSLTAAIGFKF